MYLVNEIQEVYRLQGVTISDKAHRTSFARCSAWVKIEEVGDTAFLLRAARPDRFRFNEENQRVLMSADVLPSAQPAPRHHQGVALYRQLHLGSELPGDHPRPHRGLDQRIDRYPPRPQGKRHRRPPHPRPEPAWNTTANVQLSPELEEVAAQVQQEVASAIEAEERELELMRMEGEQEEWPPNSTSYGSLTLRVKP